MTSPAKVSVNHTRKPTTKKSEPKAALKPVTKLTAKKPLKKSANDIFAEADKTLTRAYVDKLAKAMGRK